MLAEHEFKPVVELRMTHYTDEELIDLGLAARCAEDYG